MNAAERREPAAGHQSHEHRFGLIILLMRGHDPVEAELPQLPVSRDASGSLDPRAADFIRVERRIEDVQRNVVSRTELADERLVGIGIGSAEVMIDVRRLERHAA